MSDNLPTGSPDAERPAASGGPALSFADQPRLELDQLLGQLVDRAQEVMATQGRLRGLLRANQLITGDLELSAVLRRIVTAARDLVGARYAALGVVDPDGGLAEFVHTELSDKTRRRVHDLLAAEATAGQPSADPGTLRVPIRVRDEVFGNLYLGESTRGGFTAEDAELTRALAATAGVAIQNARLYESARSRGEWLQASAAVTRELLAADSADAGGALQLIAERSRELADADVLALMLPDEPGGHPDHLRIEVAVGKDFEKLYGRRAPVASSLAGRAFLTAAPVRVPHARDVPGWSSTLADELDADPLLAVPLAGSRRVHGVLWAARREGRRPFTETELEMAGTFANQAAVAIELGTARREQERAAMLDDRERIATELHDHVIQRLFAAGLSLQGVAAGLRGNPAARRLEQTIHDLDRTIEQIRTTIFGLSTATPAADGIRGRVLDAVAEATPDLGFEPGLRFAGLLDARLPADVADDLVAVLREALTNVARHARARSVEVAVTVTPDRVTLEVVDDGRGFSPSSRTTGGLADLRHRAEQHDGSFTVTGAQPSGTRLTWSVPLG